MDWTIKEGNRLFADTRFKNTWCIYHDALSQWWERGKGGAQEYMASRGFANRQWRARGGTNDRVAAYYKDRLMGDSPELMPLDSSLFGDLIEKVAYLVVSTASNAGEDRFSMGTPDEAWRAMTAAWELVPDERIVQDIGRFRSAVATIIAAKGAYVEAADLRNGHRQVMQRLVRGGRLIGGSDAAREATVTKIEAGIAEAMATWAGISGKFSVSSEK